MFDELAPMSFRFEQNGSNRSSSIDIGRFLWHAELMKPREIAASEFKQRCLALLDRVKEDKVSYVVTKHGKPVAMVTPLPPTTRRSTEGSVTLLSDNDEDYFSTGARWSAEDA